MNMFADIYDTVRTLPWPELKVPEYKETKLGAWTLKRYPRNLPMLRGYFNGLMPLTEENWVLRNGGKLWMSLTPMELESAMPHVAAAHGHTVIMGFGLGMVAYNVLAKPEVTKVTVIEIDPTVVTLVRRASDMNHWPGIEKLTLHYTDALEWIPDEPVDVVLADIWMYLGDEALRPDMVTIAANTNPTLIAGWGMELDYVTWMAEEGYAPEEADLDTYILYADDVRLPLIERDNEEYPELAFAAAENVILY